MEMLVCIKQVPGTSEVEVDEVTGVLKRNGIDSKMNPYDLYAIETALRIKEENGGRVSVLSMGPPQGIEIIKEAFMMGADIGTLLSDKKFAGADVLATSYTLSQGIRKMGNYDLIICGKQTTDGDTAQVGPEIAEFLDIPHITNVKRVLEVKKTSVIVEYDMPNRIEIAEIQYPCLITIEKDIYQPRLPSFKLKLSTKNYKINHYALEDLCDKDEMKYGLKGSPTQVLKIFPPKSNKKHELITGSSDVLIERLEAVLKEHKFI